MSDTIEKLPVKERPHQRSFRANERAWQRIKKAAAKAGMSKNAFILKWALHGAAMELAKTAGEKPEEAKNEQ